MYIYNAFSRIGCQNALIQLCCVVARKTRWSVCSGAENSMSRIYELYEHSAVVKLGPDFGAPCVSVLPGLKSIGVSS